MTPATLLLLLPVAFAQPPIPAGLWVNPAEGLIVRIAPCGAGFCGYAAGTKKQNPPANFCGTKLFLDFIWNEKKHPWEGSLQPPEMKTPLNATATTDGKNNLTVRASIAFLSKTLTLQSFTGDQANLCALEK